MGRGPGLGLGQAQMSLPTVIVQLSNENNLAVAVPEGLQSWAWSDGDNDSLKLIQPNKEYVLNGVVGSVPSFGETMAGGVIFHIDTVNGKVLLASSEFTIQRKFLKRVIYSESYVL